MNNISIAAKFGRMEHRMGRWLFVPIVISIAWSWYNNDIVGMMISTVTFTYWVVYLFSHTFEKKFYGKGLRK